MSPSPSKLLWTFIWMKWIKEIRFKNNLTKTPRSNYETCWEGTLSYKFLGKDLWKFESNYENIFRRELLKMLNCVLRWFRCWAFITQDCKLLLFMSWRLALLDQIKDLFLRIDESIVVYICIFFYAMPCYFALPGWCHACNLKKEGWSFRTGILVGGWRRTMCERKIRKERISKLTWKQIRNCHCQGRVDGEVQNE